MASNARLPGNQLVRFILAGGVNAAFGFAVFSVFALLGASNWLAVLGGNLAGLAFNFLTHGALVFRQLAWRNLPRFAGCYAILLVVNTVLLGWLEGPAGGKLIAQALLTIPLAGLSYLLMSRWVFRGAPGGGAG